MTAAPMTQERKRTGPPCIRCKEPTGGDSRNRSGLCRRCSNHARAELRKHASTPTDAQRAAWSKSKERLTTIKRATPSVCPESPTGAHHFIIPSLPQAEGTYVATCKHCGQSKEQRPWAYEDEARKKGQVGL